VTVLVEFPNVAVIVPFVAVVTEEVLTVNETLVPPAATRTEEGTVTDALLEASFTESPEAPAGLASVTVAYVLAPPVTLVAVSVRLEMVAGSRVKVVVFVELPRIAVKVTVTDPLTA
jgi:hypothetical protein